MRSRYLQYKTSAGQQEQSAKGSYQDTEAEAITHGFQPESKEVKAENAGESAHTKGKPSFLVRVYRFWWRRRKLGSGPNWAERTTVILTAGILIAAGTQAYIYWQQLASMRAQVEQTERSLILSGGQLSAATNALKNSQRFFQIEQRPYIVVDEHFPQFYQHEPVAEQNVVVNIQLKNLGKTPAIHVVSEIKLFPVKAKLIAGLTKKELQAASEDYVSVLESNFSELKKKNDRARKAIAELDRRNLSPGSDVAPQKTYIVSSQENVIISKNDLPLFQTGELSLFIIGTVTYTDAYGNPIYDTEYCSFWWGGGGALWHFCDSHNRNR